MADPARKSSSYRSKFASTLRSIKELPSRVVINFRQLASSIRPPIAAPTAEEIVPQQSPLVSLPQELLDNVSSHIVTPTPTAPELLDDTPQPQEIDRSFLSLNRGLADTHLGTLAREQLFIEARFLCCLHNADAVTHVETKMEGSFAKCEAPSEDLSRQLSGYAPSKIKITARCQHSCRNPEPMTVQFLSNPMSNFLIVQMLASQSKHFPRVTISCTAATVKTMNMVMDILTHCQFMLRNMLSFRISSMHRYGVDHPMGAAIISRNMTTTACRQPNAWKDITSVMNYQQRTLQTHFLDQGIPIHKLCLAIADTLRISTQQILFKVEPQVLRFLAHFPSAERTAIELVRSRHPHALDLYHQQLKVLALLFQSLAEHLLRRPNLIKPEHHILITNHNIDPILSLAHNLTVRISQTLEQHQYLANTAEMSTSAYDLMTSQAMLTYALARAKTAICTKWVSRHRGWFESVPPRAGQFHQLATLEVYVLRMRRAIRWVLGVAMRQPFLTERAEKWIDEFVPRFVHLQAEIEDRRSRRSDVGILVEPVITEMGWNGVDWVGWSGMGRE